MAEATEGDTAATDNVHPIRPDVTPEPSRTKSRSKDRRAAARKAKIRSNIKVDRDASHTKALPVYAPPIAPTVTQSDVEDATPPARATAPRWGNAPASQRAAEQPPKRQPGYRGEIDPPMRADERGEHEGDHQDACCKGISQADEPR